MSQMQSSVTQQGQQSVAQLSANQQANADRALQRDQMTQQQSQFNAGLAAQSQENALDRNLSREQMAQQKAMEAQRQAAAKEAADREFAYRERQDQKFAKVSAMENRLAVLREQAAMSSQQQDFVRSQRLNEEISVLEQRMAEEQEELQALTIWNRTLGDNEKRLQAITTAALEDVVMQDNLLKEQQAVHESAVATILGEFAMDTARVEQSGDRPLPIVGALSKVFEVFGDREGFGAQDYRAGRVSFALKDGPLGQEQVVGVQPVIANSLEARLRDKLASTLTPEQAAVVAASMVKSPNELSPEQQAILFEVDPNFLVTLTRGAENAFRQSSTVASNNYAQLPSNESPVLRENLEAQVALFRNLTNNSVALRQQAEQQEGFTDPMDRQRQLRQTRDMLIAQLENPLAAENLTEVSSQLDNLQQAGVLAPEHHRMFKDVVTSTENLFRRFDAEEMTPERQERLENSLANVMQQLESHYYTRASLQQRGADVSPAQTQALLEALNDVHSFWLEMAGE